MDIYFSKQANDLLVRFKLRQRPRKPTEPFDSFVGAMREIIFKCTFCKNCEESVHKATPSHLIYKTANKQ